MREQIQEGFMVFTSDGDAGIGSVRGLRDDGEQVVVYIENAGDFVLPRSAISAVHSGKVVLDVEHLDAPVREALRHTREAEFPDDVVTNTDDGQPLDS